MSYKPTLSQISKPQLAVISLGLVATAAIAFTTPAMQPQVQTVPVYIAPENYTVSGLVLGHGAGSATVRLDNHNVLVSFEYTTFEDDYGAPGSEFMAFEINSLTVEKITDDLGEQYSDYITQQEVVSIKNLVTAYVYQSGLEF